MRDRAQDKRPVLILLVLLLLLGAVGEAETAPADERVVRASSGRTAADEPPSIEAEPAWAMTVGGGLSAGGDLFRVRALASVEWTAPLADTVFTARRFTVTLDESAYISFGMSRRITRRGWLRADFAWTEMNATALAATETVTPVLFDTVTMTRMGLTWEHRLLDTPFAPYVVVGACYLDVSAKAEYMGQSGIAPEFGVGGVYRMSGPWMARIEFTDTIFQFDSSGIQEEGWPVGAVYAERGPQHLIALGAGLSVMF